MPISLLPTLRAAAEGGVMSKQKPDNGWGIKFQYRQYATLKKQDGSRVTVTIEGVHRYQDGDVYYDVLECETRLHYMASQADLVKYVPEA